jgi:hypothetical protein
MPVFESEKEFEDILMDNEEILSGEFGGCCFYNQVNLFGYGVADIVGFSAETDSFNTYLTITVYELKVGKIDSKAIEQICRYRTAINRFVDIKFNGKRTNIDVRCVLIGSKMSSGGCCYVADAIDCLSVYSYDINPLTGISIKGNNGWYLIGEDFSRVDRDVVLGALRTINDSRKLYRYELALSEKQSGVATNG